MLKTSRSSKARLAILVAVVAVTSSLLTLGHDAQPVAAKFDPNDQYTGNSDQLFGSDQFYVTVCGSEDGEDSYGNSASTGNCCQMNTRWEGGSWADEYSAWSRPNNYAEWTRTASYVDIIDNYGNNGGCNYHVDTFNLHTNMFEWFNGRNNNKPTQEATHPDNNYCGCWQWTVADGSNDLAGMGTSPVTEDYWDGFADGWFCVETVEGGTGVGCREEGGMEVDFGN